MCTTKSGIHKKSVDLGQPDLGVENLACEYTAAPDQQENCQLLRTTVGLAQIGNFEPSLR